MRITAESTLRDVAFVVCTALGRAKVTAVLTGGSAATVHALGAYQSRDLDFIIEFRSPESDAAGVLASLGYRMVTDHYEHSSNPLYLEFPKGPLAIGGDLINRWDTMKEGKLSLHIITPTDCCRDRLSGFFHWSDRSALQQAVLVAAAQRSSVDLTAIREWSVREGFRERFEEFLQAVDRAR